MSKNIVTIALGTVLIGGGLWLSSGEGPLPEKFRYHKDSVFKWTPDNIRENPELWYKSARRELTEIRRDLATSRFSITQKRIRWANLGANSKAKTKGYKAFLAQAKPQYSEAEAGRTWPVSVNGRQFDQTKLQSAIVKVHRDRERERKRVRTYTDMVAKAESMGQKLTEKMEALVQLDLDLALGQEMAEAAKSLVDLNGLTNRGQDIATTAAALQIEMEGLFDADLSFAAPQGSVDEATFNSIMSEGRVEVFNPIESLD